MKSNLQIYKWKIKKGAFAYMCTVLNFSDAVDFRMDEKICRITVTSYTIKDNIKTIFHKELSGDYLFQVKINGIDDREFLILQSQLIELDEIVFP